MLILPFPLTDARLLWPRLTPPTPSAAYVCLSRETTERAFRCAEWTPQVEPGWLWRIQCTCEQVFYNL